MFFQADKESGRVCAYAETNCLVDAIEADYPDDMTADTMQDWRIEGGKLVHDPLPVVPDRLDEIEAAICELYEMGV